MPETIIPPTPERAQHDEIAVQPAGRRNAARIYVKPFWDTWHEKGILDDKQRQAAQMFVQDHEQLQRGTNSCLASLDRIDHAGGVILAEGVSEAQARIDAVRAALPLQAYSSIYAVLVYGMKPANATNQHHSIAQGMIIMALEIMTKAYGLKT